jgi:hypothetical protein
MCSNGLLLHALQNTIIRTGDKLMSIKYEYFKFGKPDFFGRGINIPTRKRRLAESKALCRW